MISGPKTVVVAEDEILIRMLAAELLADAGFDVIEASQAEEAFAALQSRPWAIHLLFTDIHMPGRMNGLELAHHVRRVWPHIALLITSAKDKPRQTPAGRPVGSVFLAKPYHPDDVVAHVRTLTATSSACEPPRS